MEEIENRKGDCGDKQTSDGAFPVADVNAEDRGSGAILKLVEVGEGGEMGEEVGRDSEEGQERGIDVELDGESFDAYENFSVLALVDVSHKVKKMRKIPAFLHLSKPATIIGNGKQADFKVDDFETVRRQHGAIVFRNGRFCVVPLQGVVVANGKGVSGEGEVLENGSRIEMGSASFLFLTV